MNIPPELYTFFAAMLPILELRGAIPLGILMGVPPLAAAFYAILGNIVPCILILLVLEPISNFLIKHSKFFENFFKKLFKKTHSKHKPKILKYGPIFLIIFVAIPLPVSGAWTGSLIAFLFGIKFWKSLAYITTGLFISAFIVTTLTVGGISLF